MNPTHDATPNVNTLPQTAAGTLHRKLVLGRRGNILSDWFARIIPHGASLLDVGCGSGQIAALLHSKRPDISVRGIDVLPRTETYIPVDLFDGAHIPFAAMGFDVVLLSDVLHHTSDPEVLLREATRVARYGVLIKDHYRKGIAARARLRFMDWVGNARFGVSLPYNYWTEAQWQAAWTELGLHPERLVTKLGLYPAPFDWIFGAQLHFVGLLRQADRQG
ncbi:MAG: class I SAM-dependent methyltransferase [Acidobacteriales bacterium]|nr:class I SAM-dependent methyltransferase [Terriglobales bacterium]